MSEAADPTGAPASPVAFSPRSPRPWKQYAICVLLHMLFPLAPLLLEDIFTDHITLNSITLATAMYSISIAASSQDVLLFVCGLIVAVLLSSVFGYVVAHLQTPDARGPDNFIFRNLYLIETAILAHIFIFHAGERYRRHITRAEPFLLFCP